MITQEQIDNLKRGEKLITKNMKKKNKLKKGAKIWFYYGAGHIQAVEFIRWCKTKMNTGREDTDKIGVGSVVKSDWLFKIHGGKRSQRTQVVLRPYTQLYRTYRSARNYRNQIKRPKINEL